MRILALDVGEKRIGVAVSDPLGITAQGLDTIQRTSIDEDLAFIAKLAKEKEASEIVVGLPLNMNGTLSQNAKGVLIFIEKLKGVTGVPINTWDERLSTMQSERILLEADVSRKKRKGVLDKMSAQVILQGYLGFKGNKIV